MQNGSQMAEDTFSFINLFASPVFVSSANKLSTNRCIYNTPSYPHSTTHQDHSTPKEQRLMASLQTLGMIILIYGIVHFIIFLIPFIRLHQQGRWSLRVACHVLWAMFWISLGIRMLIAGLEQTRQQSQRPGSLDDSR
jgi:hypothetical protein